MTKSLIGGELIENKDPQTNNNHGTRYFAGYTTGGLGSHRQKVKELQKASTFSWKKILLILTTFFQMFLNLSGLR